MPYAPKDIITSKKFVISKSTHFNLATLHFSILLYWMKNVQESAKLIKDTFNKDVWAFQPAYADENWVEAIQIVDIFAL